MIGFLLQCKLTIKTNEYEMYQMSLQFIVTLPIMRSATTEY